MESKAKNEPRVRSRLGIKAAASVSLALNVALLVGVLAPPQWIRWARGSETRRLEGEESVRPPVTVGNNDVTLDREKVADGHPRAPMFQWREVESEDPAQYIANLRSVGCPEPLIRDLIAARLNQFYTPQADALVGVKVSKYWEKEERLKLTPAQRLKDKALADERDRKFMELLGTPFADQAHSKLINLQLSAVEQWVLFLPEAQREAATRRLAEVERLEAQTQDGTPPVIPSAQDDENLFKKKILALTDVLSASDLEEFRLRNSPAAQQLRSETRYFDCTSAEFARLMDGRERRGTPDVGNDLLNRGPATAQVRELLGHARAQEFEKTTDLFYVEARRRLEEAGLQAEVADEVWQISRDARSNAEQAAGDTRLSLSQRRQQVGRLSRQYQEALIQLMGEPASRSVRQSLSAILSTYGRDPQP